MAGNSTRTAKEMGARRRNHEQVRTKGGRGERMEKEREGEGESWREREGGRTKGREVPPLYLIYHQI